MAGESPKAQDIRRQSRILRNALRSRRGDRSTFVPSGSTGWIDDPVAAGVLATPTCHAKTSVTAEA
jgi:hypothetical protein